MCIRDSRAAVLGSMQGSVAGGVDAVEKIPVARIVEALENPGAEYQHNGMARRFPDIRFIWWSRVKMYWSLIVSLMRGMMLSV